MWKRTHNLLQTSEDSHHFEHQQEKMTEHKLVYSAEFGNLDEVNNLV